ncbi:fructose-bisphosphate aldolase, class I [Paucidesulfovibrio gracilis DSM 16080]|uniref:2-amino-3,7-dideoxy-D-threo-hept-6-ulosonate synthase n=1 Tax=Paucidesulfovibrio gracilis DSM 16080 TaxID=1121449 RepID=A0A1T4X911_9BACT|nr:2-amino-3,7-dideoxy-D-threo-hept-6-ulosonate synthase [Paucidesulfovibrio gracilis]SKA85575.1 fructose-bisphosphate aldolase, class I [Paucidesulfovibrio gracilis DSM 16080]
MNTGKALRLDRIFNRNTRRTIVVPMDHGVTVGPIQGLEDIREMVTRLVNGGANAGLVHKGCVACGHRSEGRDFGLIVHLSASTSLSPFPNRKALVTTVEEALRMGADGVSVHVNIGDENESVMLEHLGSTAERADYWGIPLLAMVYARGPKIRNEYEPEVVAHCARVGMELGADIVKVNYTGSVESFAHVTESCCVPVVIAGGEKLDSTQDLLEMVKNSLMAGGAGLSVGRNVFQHDDPTGLVRALHHIVHENGSVDEAMRLLEN